MSVYLGGCAGCGPCSGKWKALAAKVFWYGYEGYFSTIDQSAMTGGCGAGCDYSAATSSPPTRYLQRKIRISGATDVVSTSWDWDGSAWVIGTPIGFHIAGHDNGTWTIDKRKGDVFVGDDCSFDYVESTEAGGGGYCPGDVVLSGIIGIAGIDVFSKWRNLEYRCGTYTSPGASCFPGGSASDLIDWLTNEHTLSGTVTATVDTQTDNHVGFDASQSYTYGPIDAPSTPGSPGDSICRQTVATSSLSVKIDLSSPYGWDALVGECVGLLGSYGFNLYPWRSFDEINSACQSIPMLKYNSRFDSSGTGSFESCDYANDPTFDGSVLGGPEAMIPADFAIPWGASANFTASTYFGGTLTMVKWAMRQGKYKPFGWQVDAPKTWNFMFQQWSGNLCSLDATYECEDWTGAEGYVMCISPNTESWITVGHQFAFPIASVLQPEIGERNNGGVWQAVCRDSVPDTYDAFDPDNPVEPLCSRNCPTADAGPTPCTATSIGDCPGDGGSWNIPLDNWP